MYYTDGGAVKADAASKGTNGAGIGGGDRDGGKGGEGGTCIIYGGEVTAKGGEDGAGIGSGSSKWGNIIINGGTINAKDGANIVYN